MKLDIQKFATWEELTDYYNKNLNETQAKINELQAQKQADINDYEANYQNQLSEYKDLQNQQQNYINAWAENQKEQQQKQTDYNIGLINQAKQEAAEETKKQTQDAYVDYMKQTNQYGGALENLASRGLATQGYAESSKVGMYNTYQNRVATANETLVKANVQYDNQIQQALLTNDAALAETALEQMKQSYQLALQGFDYTSNLYNQKITYLQGLEDTYFNRSAALQALADEYVGQIGSIKQYQEQMSASKAKSSGSGRSSGGSSSGGTVYTETSNTNYNNSASTQAKDDYYFSNGYQPRYVNDVKLSNSEGWQASQILTPEECASLGVKQTQNIWKAGGNYYLWLGSSREYVDVTDYINNAKKNPTIQPGTTTKINLGSTGSTTTKKTSSTKSSSSIVKTAAKSAAKSAAVNTLSVITNNPAVRLISKFI